MRRAVKAVCLVLVLGLAVIGCGKKSGLEGKVVDGAGKPISGMKIIAKQVQPIKGYEQFEATTGSDGAFKFSGLFPTSEYILMPWLQDWSVAPMILLKYEEKKLMALFNKDGWFTEQKMSILSGPEGLTRMLVSPIIVQPFATTITGKAINWQGKATANITVVARQIQAVPGYEQFETITGADGSFRFEKLFPEAGYRFMLKATDGPVTEMREMQTGYMQQSGQLSGILTPVRFISSNGALLDTKTGLQWTPDLMKRDITWDEAKEYVAQLNYGGFSDWRLPTRAELKSLYDPSIKADYKIDSMFQLSNYWVWTEELVSNDSSSAWHVGFTKGNENSYYRSTSNNNRVLAVRFPR